MPIRKVLYGILLILLFTLKVQAQQAIYYSQYILNSFLLNPAIAGAEGYSSVNLTAREQWIGVPDAPSTSAISFHTKIGESKLLKKRSPIDRIVAEGFSKGKVGLGGYLFNDKYGGQGRTGMRVSYAYHLYNNKYRSQLSLGFSLTAYQLKFDEDWVMLRDPDDDIWNTAREAMFIPDADVGVYYSTPDYFIGFSVDQLLESIIKFGPNALQQYKMERNYYLMGGYDFDLGKKLLLTPSVFLKFAENGPFQLDLSGKILYDQKYWLGLTYRTGDALIVLAGLSIDKYVFGYAFDASLSNIMKQSYGSHEFTFALKLGETNKIWLNR